MLWMNPFLLLRFASEVKKADFASIPKKTRSAPQELTVFTTDCSGCQWLSPSHWSVITPDVLTGSSREPSPSQNCIFLRWVRPNGTSWLIQYLTYMSAFFLSHRLYNTGTFRSQPFPSPMRPNFWPPPSYLCLREVQFSQAVFSPHPSFSPAPYLSCWKWLSFYFYSLVLFSLPVSLIFPLFSANADVLALPLSFTSEDKQFLHDWVGGRYSVI